MQEGIQAGFEYPQWRRFHSLSGRPHIRLCNLHSAEIIARVHFRGLLWDWLLGTTIFLAKMSDKHFVFLSAYVNIIYQIIIICVVYLSYLTLLRIKSFLKSSFWCVKTAPKRIKSRCCLMLSLSARYGWMAMVCFHMALPHRRLVSEQPELWQKT